MRWHDLLAGLDVRERVRDADVEVTSITEDSRRVVPGACFAAGPVGAFDGHEHAGDAVAAGAVALLVERALPLEVPQARVEQCAAHARSRGGPPLRRAVAVAALPRRHRYRGEDDHHDAARVDRVCRGETAGLIGSDGVFVGGERISVETSTPTMPQADQLQELLALMRDRGVGTVAMEVTSRALDQHRVDGTWFAVGVLHQSESRASRRPRFDGGVLRSEGRALRSRACRRRSRPTSTIRTASRFASVHVLPVSTSGATACDAQRRHRCDRRRARRRGASFVLVDRRTGATEAITIPLLGDFNVINALAAAATARAAGLTLDVDRRRTAGRASRSRPGRAHRRRPALHRARRLRPLAR